MVFRRQANRERIVFSYSGKYRWITLRSKVQRMLAFKQEFEGFLDQHFDRLRAAGEIS